MLARLVCAAAFIVGAIGWENCNYFVDNTRPWPHPTDLCYGDYDSAVEIPKSYMYECDESEQYIIKWEWDSIGCFNDTLRSDTGNYSHSSGGGVDFYCGGVDCGISIRQYYPGDHGDEDASNMCEGMTNAVKSTANYTDRVYVANSNCSWAVLGASSYSTVQCNESRVTFEAYPEPDCDALPYESHRSWRNVEGNCYDITCPVSSNLTTSLGEFDAPASDDALFSKSCKYISVWDEEENDPGDQSDKVYAINQCGNARSTGTNRDITYSYQFSCSDNDDTVYLYYYILPDCQGISYFGQYWTEDDADFSCSGSASVAAQANYFHDDFDCGKDNDNPLFLPNEYYDMVHATDRCVSYDEEGEQGSRQMICDDDVLQIWTWDTERCNGTHTSYSEDRTGCTSYGYQEIYCGKTHSLLTAASNRYVTSWVTIALVTTLFYLTL